MSFELFAQIQDATEAARQVLENANTTPVVPQETTLSVWELIKMGGWYIMGPLALMSLTAVYIIIERTMAINRALRDEKDFMAKIRDYIREGKIDSARNLCQTSNTPVARMLEKGINRIGKPLKDIEVSIENQGKLEVYRLESGLPIISGAAPMVGFLGTVVGMVITFHTMEVSGAGVELSQLSGGMMQAMITTVAGLIIGIPAYVGYNLLVARVNKVVQKMESRSIEFMEVLESPAK
ncbi:MAG TPA: MotA/TolQ/ExbB proton channel family protein [Flavobacteriales bacterium]|nr:MotA/TolQ/ExbB proton channel family protein [Flavobacteriales bacterium]